LQKLLQRIETVPVWGLALVIGLIAFFQYSNSFNNDYALDDTIVIVENAKVRDGLVNLSEYFVKSNSQLLEDQYGYRPITLISLALDAELLGPGPYNGHLMNAFYYALLCMVIFFTLKKIFPRARLLFLFVVVLLFAVHPLHVEAIANVKSRDEILAMLFGLLSVRFFIEWLRDNKIYGIPLSILALGLGFLSKESAVIFLAILPLSALVQLDLPVKKRILRTSLILGACLGIVVGVVALTQASTVDNLALTEGAGIKMEDKIMGNAIFQQHQEHERIATGTGILLRYIKNFLVPYPLVYYSGYNQIPLTGFGDPLVIASLLLHLLLAFLSVWFFKKHPLVTFGIWFYFISISPYTHFLRPLSDAMADRFMFVPSLGLCLLLVYGLLRLAKIDWQKDAQTSKPDGKKKKGKVAIAPGAWTPFGIGMVALVLVFAGLTFNRNKAWKDNLTLFSTDIPHLEDCARCHFHYAEAMSITYVNSTEKARLKPEIIRHFRRAIEITPEAYNSYISLGRFFYAEGMYEEGHAVLKDAIAYFPEEGRPYFHLGYGLMAQLREAEAIPYFEKTVELAPNREEAYFYYAWSHYNVANYEKGISLMELALAKFPENSATYHNALTDMCVGIGQLDKGFGYLNDALTKEPNNPNIYKKFISTYQQIGDTASAEAYIQQALNRGIPL